MATKNDELTEREAAKYLRISHSRLKYLRQSGRGPVYLDYGWRTKRYLKSDLDEWRRERRRIARTRRFVTTQRVGYDDVDQITSTD